MGQALRLLLVEDQENDAALLLHALERLGYDVDCRRVETREAMQAALAAQSWDLIISDFSLPQFSAKGALEVYREQGPEIPFIIVSGTIEEEDAVESMRRGAHDFITKGRLARLGPAIQRGQREFEERRARHAAEARLQQAQKLEVVGQLAGGVAHDFNNLLGVILGCGELLLGRLGEDEASRRRLGQILEAANRGAALTRQLLTFSRHQPFQARAVELNPLVAAMEPMLRRVIREDIQITVALEPRLYTVHADPTQIEQVLMNLAVNARDAMGAGGRLVIETRNVDLDASYVRSHPDVTPGSYAMLAVSDTGHGMDARTLARIFEPFFTTKEPGKGTGLGLATVYGIVRQSGGHIAVYSEVGQGTTFKVYLPRSESPAAEAHIVHTPAPQTGSETILLVEDDGDLRDVVEQLLLAGGYSVLTGDSPEAALQAAELHRGRVDLIITDLTMPRINGRQAQERLHVSHPEARALYMSGYATAFAEQGASLPEHQAFIQKPFSLDALLHKVREVLDAPL